MSDTLELENRPVPATRADAQLAGAFYAINIATILGAVFLLRGIVVANDPASTAANLVAHAARYQSAIGLEVISTAASIAVAAFLFGVFKPVDSSAALLAAFFRLTACGVAIVEYVFQLASLQIFQPSPYLAALTRAQVLALAYVPLRLSARASSMVIVLFGFHFLVVGYLAFRSGVFPRTLSALMALAGTGGLIFLAPALGARVFPYFAGIGFVSEVWLALYLLTRSATVTLA
jgi:hypothetical protein